MREIQGSLSLQRVPSRQLKKTPISHSHPNKIRRRRLSLINPPGPGLHTGIDGPWEAAKLLLGIFFPENVLFSVRMSQPHSLYKCCGRLEYLRNNFCLFSSTWGERWNINKKQLWSGSYPDSKNNTFKNLSGRNKYYGCADVSGDRCAFFLSFFLQEKDDNWYIYLEDSLPILFEDYKKLFKLQANISPIFCLCFFFFFEENQQIENLACLSQEGCCKKQLQEQRLMRMKTRGKATPFFFFQEESPNFVDKQLFYL